MKRALTLMTGVAVTVALVGCGKNNPAGPSALPAISSKVQEYVYTDPSQGRSSVEDRLVGVWEMKQSGDETFRITLKKGGEVDVTAPVAPGLRVTVSGAWQATENRLTLTANVAEEKETQISPILRRFVDYTYSLSGHLLTLTNPDGVETRWEKL